MHKKLELGGEDGLVYLSAMNEHGCFLANLMALVRGDQHSKLDRYSGHLLACVYL